MTSRFERNRERRLLPLLLLAAMLAWPTQGLAETSPNEECVQDLAGRKLVCTANDIRVKSITATNVPDKCSCLNCSDTATFEGTLTVQSNASQRFDVAAFVAEDGGDALTGECSITTVPFSPDPFANLDQDACGDVAKPGEGTVPIGATEVACVDRDEDGQVDVGTCSSWRQSGKENTTCNEPDDAFPGSPSKCNCAVVNVEGLFEPATPTPTEVPPTATPTATETAEPTATPTETPEPTATETSPPEPTATPTSTGTPEPTATDTPEATPTATGTPEATATPTATETPSCPAPAGDSDSRAFGLEANVPLLDPFQPLIDALLSPNPGPLLIDATPDTDVPGGAPSPFVSIPLSPLLEVNALTVDANQSSSATDASSDATATTADVHLLDPGTGFVINADAIVASVSCSADQTSASSSDEGSKVEGLTIGGQNFDTITEPVSVVLNLPIGRVEVHVLEKVASGAAAGELQPNPQTDTMETGLAVNGIHVKVTDPMGGIVADVIVAHAECDASVSGVCEPLPHVSGHGYTVGVEADESIIDPLGQLASGRVGEVRLNSTGGSDDATLKHIGPIGQGGQVLIESNTAFSHTEGTTDPEADTAHAETLTQVEDLEALDPGTGPVLTADLVRAECSSDASGPLPGSGSSSGNAIIAGLTLGGEDVCAALGLAPTPGCPNGVVCCEPPPNTDVCAELSLTPLCDGLGLSLILNEQTVQQGNPTAITVNAIHLTLDGPLPAKADVIVAHAHCDAGSAGTEIPPHYAFAPSLNQPPASMLAFLFGTGAVGLLLPIRRSRATRRRR